MNEELAEATVEKEPMSAERKVGAVGKYTVEYYMISSNGGHPIQVSFSSQVAKGSPSPIKESGRAGRRLFR